MTWSASTLKEGIPGIRNLSLELNKTTPYARILLLSFQGGAIGLETIRISADEFTINLVVLFCNKT